MSPYPADELKRLEGRPEAAWLWDAERRRIVWANRAGLAFWGELTLLDLLERRFAADLPAVARIAELGRELEGGTAATERLVFHPRDGERTVAARCSARPLDDGRTGVLVIEVPDAAPEAADDAARAVLFEAAIEALPIPLAVFDRHGSLVLHNAACRETFDAAAGAGGVLAAWMADDRRAEALIERGLTLGSASEAETMATRFGARAQRVTVRRIAAPIHGREALLLVFEDIEDRRRLERQRERELARVEGYLAAAAEVTFEIDAKRRLTDIDGRLGELFGLDAASLIGLDLDTVAARLRLVLPEPVRHRLSRLQRVAGAMVAAAPRDGAERVFVLAACPVLDAAGATVALRGSLLGLAEASLAPAPSTAEPAAPEPEEETTERPWPPPSGDDVATFSEIGRAVAASAEEARRRAERLRRTPEIEGEEAADEDDEDEVGAAPVRRVPPGAAAPRAAERVSLAIARARAAARRRLDAGALDAAGEPALVLAGLEILYASDGLARLLGHTDAAALIADRSLLALFPDERARLLSLLSRLDEAGGDTGEPLPVSLKAKTADLGARTLVAHIEPVTFEGGPAALMRFSADAPPAPHRAEAVPARPAAALPVPRAPAAPIAAPGEDELVRSRAREAELGEIINAAADGIATLDGEGRIVMLNASAEAIFGVPGGEVEGRPLAELFSAEAGRTIAAYLQSLTEDGVSGLHREGRELEGRRADGSTIPLFLTIGRMGGPGPRFCVVIRDISQWKRAEADLRAAKEAAESASTKKSDFLAKISHELRTPLNAIIGFSEMMSAEKFGPIENDRYRGYLADIRTSGQHLLGLINDLLDLSKVEAGKLELNFASVDMVAVVQQCVGLMQPQSSREQVIMRTSLPDHLPHVVADERAMRQVMLNLLSNAIKFTPEGGQVIVSALLDEEGRLQVRVRDTGVGMSAEDLSRAMEPFRQIEQAMQVTSLAGTGLGLPLTKALVEANRAEFRVESTPNAGTLVQIIFPSERVLAG